MIHLIEREDNVIDAITMLTYEIPIRTTFSSMVDFVSMTSYIGAPDILKFFSPTLSSRKLLTLGIFDFLGYLHRSINS